MKKHIITITGFPGSGKSSTAKGVARELGYEHFSSGDMFREMAKARDLSVEEINFAAETQKEIDREVDELLVRVGKEKDRLVIDSRTAFHWIQGSFKVFLDLDPRTSAERTFAHIQKEGRESQIGSSVEEIHNNTVRRVESERKRFKSLYGIDLTDKTSFDLIVDTKTHGLEEVIKIVTEAYKNWLSLP